MKIAVFLDVYTPTLDTKDTGQLVSGFMELGHNCEIIGISGAVSNKSNKSGSRFPIRYITHGDAVSPAFWGGTNYDLVICYTWLRKKYLPMLSAIRKSAIKLIIKSDNDGRHTYPVTPRWGQDVVPLFSISYFRILLRKLQRRVLVNFYLRAFVNHIELADVVIIESPGAYANIAALLVHAGKPDLIAQIFPVQNPVDQSALICKLPLKRKLVVAVGDWKRIVGEGFQKNTDCMIKVVSKFLRIEPEYDVVIIGDLGGREEYFAKLDISQRNRLTICGNTVRQDMLEYLGQAQIFFMPSMTEGFSIAASEAVCMGCSIVGTPLECLVYLARGGIGGTISYDFKTNAVFGALLADVNRWKRGDYDANDISQYWRARLASKLISQLILNSVMPAISAKQP